MRALAIVSVVLVAIAVPTIGITVAAGAVGGDDPVAPAVDPSGDGDEADDSDEGESGDEGDGSLSSDAGNRAAEAALAETGAGEVLAVESDDDGAGYEVEIRLDNGDEVEVELDTSFSVVQRPEE